MQNGEIGGIPEYVGALFMKRQLKPTERDRARMLARGISVELDSFISARLMRAMALGIDPDKLAQGDGANKADVKPYFQSKTEVTPALGDGREQARHGCEYFFCADFNQKVGCKRPHRPFIHACNYCRSGPWRRQTTGCVNTFLSCCFTARSVSPEAAGHDRRHRAVCGEGGHAGVSMSRRVLGPPPLPE